ncbi:MAG: hypothetical protein WKG06_13650 [Segetibacter sp.]
MFQLQEDKRKPWETSEVNAQTAIRGFYNTTLTLKNITPTAAVLTDIFGYKLQKQEGNRYRYTTDAIETASAVDLIEAPNAALGRGAASTNHHVAFRVKDDNMMEYRKK